MVVQPKEPVPNPSTLVLVSVFFSTMYVDMSLPHSDFVRPHGWVKCCEMIFEVQAHLREKTERERGISDYLFYCGVSVKHTVPV